MVNPLTVAPFAAWPGPADPGRGSAPNARWVSPETQQAVERLVHAYAYAWDGRDPGATADLFTDTGAMSFYLNGSTTPTHHAQGRYRLLDDLVARSGMLNRWRIETRHLMLNTVCSATSDGAVEAMTTAMIFWQRLPEHPAPTPVQTGYYRSRCVEAGGAWRFQRREAHLAGIFHPEDLYPFPDRGFSRNSASD